MGRGEEVSWKTLNGIRSGIIEGEHEKGYIVRLSNGKMVIVHPKSFINNQ